MESAEGAACQWCLGNSGLSLLSCKFFVCGVPESAGSVWLLCPAQPLIYPWPGEGGLLEAVCVLPSVSGTAGVNTGDMGSWEYVCLAGRAQSELMIWNPFPVEFGLEQGLRPGGNRFVVSCQCSQHMSTSVPERFLLVNRNFVTSVGLEGWTGWHSLLTPVFPAACPERCPRVHLLVPGIHGAGSDRQPCGAGGFPEGILGPPRESTTAAVPRGGGHQRQGRAAPLQVPEGEFPRQGGGNSCGRVAGHGSGVL